MSGKKMNYPIWISKETYYEIKRLKTEIEAKEKRRISFDELIRRLIKERKQKQN